MRRGLCPCLCLCALVRVCLRGRCGAWLHVPGARVGRVGGCPCACGIVRSWCASCLPVRVHACAAVGASAAWGLAVYVWPRR